jgi:hypothetical protein
MGGLRSCERAGDSSTWYYDWGDGSIQVRPTVIQFTFAPSESWRIKVSPLDFKGAQVVQMSPCGSIGAGEPHSIHMIQTTPSMSTYVHKCVLMAPNPDGPK